MRKVCPKCESKRTMVAGEDTWFCKACGFVWCEPTDRRIGLIRILLAICLFPFTITYLVIEAEKLSNRWKLIIICVMWAVLVLSILIYGDMRKI